MEPSINITIDLLLILIEMGLLPTYKQFLIFLSNFVICIFMYSLHYKCNSFNSAFSVEQKTKVYKVFGFIQFQSQALSGGQVISAISEFFYKADPRATK